MGAEDERLQQQEEIEMMLPTSNSDREKEAATPVSKGSIHPAFYIATCIALSSATIIYNKYILSTLGFGYPILLTTWHMVFGACATQLLARFTHMLDARKDEPMTARKYARTIFPIGIAFSCSIMCGNLAYLTLSVSFMQMLKGTMPIAVLLVSWAMRVTPASLATLGKVSFIVIGVVIASYGEVHFVLSGFIFQCGNIIFEAVRLVLVQIFLTNSMNPLVLLYYFSPVCAGFGGLIALVVEVPKVSFDDVLNVGYFNLLMNATIAFALNISVVLLVGKTSSLVMTLTGTLKNIILVVASIVIFGDTVTGLQVFGYTLALLGLLYYQHGSDKNTAEQMRGYLHSGQRAWSAMRERNPWRRRLVLAGATLFIVVSLIWAASLMHLLPEGYDPAKLSMNKIWAAMARTNE